MKSENTVQSEEEKMSKSELIRSGVVCGTCADEGETKCSCYEMLLETDEEAAQELMSKPKRTPQATLMALKEKTDDDRAYAVGEARRALYEARRELEEIETQLELAEAGEPYRRVGTVRGVSATAVFAAFGEIERSAVLDRMIAEQA